MKNLNRDNSIKIISKIQELIHNTNFRNLHPHALNFAKDEINFPVYISKKDAKRKEIDGAVLIFYPSEDQCTINSASIIFEGDFMGGGPEFWKCYDKVGIEMIEGIWHDFIEALETL